MIATVALTSASTPAMQPDLRLRADGDGLLIWDAACRRCPACAAGLPAACADPAAPGGSQERWRRRQLPHAERLDAGLAEVAARAHDAVTQASGPAAVLVLGGGQAAVAAAVAARGAGARQIVAEGVDAAPPGIQMVADAAEARDAFAGSGPEDRASLVLAVGGDLDRAARLVRRGGAIAALSGGEGHSPSLTTIVQRELELLPVRDLLRAALRCDLSGAMPQAREGGGTQGSGAPAGGTRGAETSGGEIR